MKFSIIIPVYNVAPYLRECLDSVLAQTFTDWEAICVDDGSTDGSGAILDEYAAKYGGEIREELTGSPTTGKAATVAVTNLKSPSTHSILKSLYAVKGVFRVIHQPNAGVSAARNAGLDVAKGEWIGFLDGDDLLLNDILKKCVAAANAIADPTIDLIWFGIRKFDEGQTVLQSVEENHFAVRDVSEFLPGRLLDADFTCFAYSRSILSDVRFEEGRRIGEDRIFFGKILAKCHKLLELQMVGYGYRQRLESMSHSLESKGLTGEMLTCWTERLSMAFQDGRQLDRRMMRRWCQVVTEEFARIYYNQGVQEQNRLIEVWQGEMEKLLLWRKRLPFSFRMVLELARACSPKMGLRLFNISGGFRRATRQPRRLVRMMIGGGQYA